MSSHLELPSTRVTQAQTAPTCPREDNWRYTARPEWSSGGESMWMRLSKFSYCNRLSVSELTDLFDASHPNNESGARDLRPAKPWDLRALASILDVSAADVQSGFCCNVPPIHGRSSAELRYCSACLKLGFHAAWFQWLTIERCPLHGLPLKLGCARCRSAIPYVLGHDLAAKPLTCACCASAWIPSLGKPAGHCVPMSGRDVRVLRRWSVYVTYVANGDPQRCPDQHTGRFATPPQSTPCATARAPLLTLVNRLFDVPPPLPVQLLARCAADRRQRLANVARSSTPSIHRAPDYERDQWPHFAEEFVGYEHQVARARHQLFADTSQGCDHGRWQHLLSSDLVVPTDAMRCETVAALGWTISWLGRTRALAPAAANSTPAVGLTAWLASLAPRAQGTRRDRWHRQVREWLNDDLRLSAWMWVRVARFMQTKGCYLLYGALVNPQDLATARRGDLYGSGIFTSIVR